MDKRYILAFMIFLVVISACFAGCSGTEATPTAADVAAETDATPAAADEKTVYKVGIDAPYPPFSIIDDEGNPSGFDSESIEWIAENQGFEIEFRQISFDGMIPALEAGKIDMIYSGMTITDERAEKVAFSNPYWTVNQAVVAKSDSDATEDELIEGKLIVGTQRGTTAEIWIEKNLIETGIMESDKLKLYDNPPLAIADLVNGRIDAVMFDSTVIDDMIEGKDIKKIGFIETDEQFGIAVRKDDTQLLAKLNTGLENLMASQDWQDLITKYRML